MKDRDTAPRQEPVSQPEQRDEPRGQHTTVTSILSLQRSAGNRAVSQLLRSGEPGRDPAALVHEALSSAGRPLPDGDRAVMEPYLGQDLSAVRLHTGPTAAASAAAVNASAYTVGSDIVFGGSPSTSTDRKLLAHELTHVAQQPSVHAPPSEMSVSQNDDREEVEARAVADAFVRNEPTPVAQPARGVAVRRNEGDGPVDAGVPLPAGVPEIQEEAPIPVEQLTDDMLGPAAEDPGASQARRTEVEAELERRNERLSDQLGIGMVNAAGPGPGTPGSAMITPEVALEILGNMSRGEPPFRPELGRGGSSWFVTEGNPYTAVDPAKTVPVQVDIAEVPGKLVFREAELLKILAEEAAATKAEAEAKFRARYGYAPDQKLSNKVTKSMARFARGFAESRMWTRVGQMVAASGPKAGEVILEPGSVFSKTPGKFAVVGDATKIKLRGGPGPLVAAVEAAGTKVEPPLFEAAEKLAAQQKWAGRVRSVFRYGGRILIVVGVTNDVIKIYYAQDKTKAVITSAGGWAGATAAGAAFAAWWTPADVAGPWAWLGHGVGTLVSGGIGYWVGSEVTRTIYELAAE